MSSLPVSPWDNDERDHIQLRGRCGEVREAEEGAAVPSEGGYCCAEPETYEFCFDGVKKGSTIAVETIGVMRSREATETWKYGMTETINRLHPSTVILYGTPIRDYNWGRQKVRFINARDGWKEERKET